MRYLLIVTWEAGQAAQTTNRHTNLKFKQCSCSSTNSYPNIYYSNGTVFHTFQYKIVLETLNIYSHLLNIQQWLVKIYGS